MAKLILSLVVVVLSVLWALSDSADGKLKQVGGGKPGFGEVGFGGQCSALDSVLPEPNSGCCGRHAGGDGDGGNGIGPDDDEDTGDDDPIGGGGGGNGYGPGDGNGIDDNEDDGSNFDDGSDDGNGYWPGNRDDDEDDFDFNNGNGWDADDSNMWDVSGNGLDDFDFDNARFKRSAENNDSNVTPDKYIIAGTPAGLAQYPWLVHLTVKIQEMTQIKMIGCGGSLISSRHVITAAHCVDFEIRDYNDVSVYLAEYNTRTFPNDCVGRQCVKNMVMHPEKIKKHPQYERAALINDIALLRLKGSAPYTDYIRPICLPQFNINVEKYAGTPLAITGWGQTENKQPSPVKLHTQVAQVPPSKCRTHYPDISKTQLCAAGKSGQDTCMGDSGGPIMMERDGTFFLVGLVSGKRADAVCGSAVPTMYTNVFSYKKWIQNFMRK